MQTSRDEEKLTPERGAASFFGRGLDRPGVLDQLATMLTGNFPSSVHIVAVTGVKTR